MKLINKILLTAGTCAMMFASCSEPLLREPSPVQDGGKQVYFLESNAITYNFLPLAKDTSYSEVKGNTVNVYNYKPQDSTATNNIEVNVLVGRNFAETEEDVKFVVIDKKGKFVVEDSITFSKGVYVDTINVVGTFAWGEKNELKLVLDSKDQTSYGASDITINVLRDYDWVDRGSVKYNCPWFAFGETTVDVLIQQAKGTELFRLQDPYLPYAEAIGFTESDPMPEGYYMQFFLDTTIVKTEIIEGDTIIYRDCSLKGVPEGIQEIGWGTFSNDYIIVWQKGWPGGANGVWCEVATVANNYTITYAVGLADQSGWYGGIPFTFVWDKGFPGVMIDEDEGEGELEVDLELTSVNSATWYGDDYTSGTAEYVVVMVDEMGNRLNVDLYAAEGLDNTDSFAGEYTINDKQEVGTALAGFNGANGLEGCYVVLPFTGTKLYLSEGKVVVTEDEAGNTTIALKDAKSLSGVEVKASWTGVLSVDDPAPAAASQRISKSSMLRPLSGVKVQL